MAIARRRRDIDDPRSERAGWDDSWHAIPILGMPTICRWCSVSFGMMGATSNEERTHATQTDRKRADVGGWDMKAGSFAFPPSRLPVHPPSSRNRLPPRNDSRWTCRLIDELADHLAGVGKQTISNHHLKWHGARVASRPMVDVARGLVAPRANGRETRDTCHAMYSREARGARARRSLEGQSRGDPRVRAGRESEIVVTQCFARRQ
jgi:hypothetical protein